MSINISLSSFAFLEWGCSFLTQENNRSHVIILIMKDCVANCAGVKWSFLDFNLYGQLVRNQCLFKQEGGVNSTITSCILKKTVTVGFTLDCRIACGIIMINAALHVDLQRFKSWKQHQHN